MTGRQRALLSLEGLSVGDAFGEQFFGDTAQVVPRIVGRIVPPGPWRYTDDTEMAVSIVEALVERGSIDQDELAHRFATRMDPRRGYGKGAYEVLSGVLGGGSWRSLSRGGFGGRGSFGNGAAMRVAPVGAFFADGPLERVVEQARQSAEVTHAHPEGIAGAIAIAVAAALAWRHREHCLLGRGWMQAVHDAVPAGYTRDAIAEALALPEGISTIEAAKVLGNGSGVSSGWSMTPASGTGAPDPIPCRGVANPA